MGSYLGFKLGPERNKSVWDAALSKSGKRSGQWRLIHTGTYFATLAYSTFIASTLLFIVLLDVPPEHALNKEMHGIKALFGGPGGCDAFSPADAFALKEQFRQHMSYKSLDCVAKASKLRVYHMCNVNRRIKHCTEKRSIEELHRSLLANIDQFRKVSNAGMNQLSQWRDWYDSSSISTLQHNARELDKDLNIRLDDCLASIAHCLPPEQREDIRLKQKREIQKTVALQTSPTNCIDSPDRVR